MPPVPTKQITEEYVILGEGDGDTAFFTYLCQIRGINGFQCDSVGGKTGFENYIKGFKDAKGIGRLRSLVVVGDNDETLDDSFRNIRRQIQRAGLPAPNNPREKAIRADAPYSVVVLMLPYPNVGANSHGCLETMLLPVAEQHLNRVVCLDDFCACTNVTGWNRTSRDKMRLRCLLSASRQDDPNIALRHALRPVADMIPLGHDALNDISYFLQHLDEWLESDVASWDEWRAAH